MVQIRGGHGLVPQWDGCFDPGANRRGSETGWCLSISLSYRRFAAALSELMYAGCTMIKSAHPTLTEVARKAGVGTTTVSRVINGGDRVSPKTLARVLREIETLGYTPNEAARTLKGRWTKTIGLVI